MRKSIALFAAFLIIEPLAACTIFLLTNSRESLYFNNEDYSNPNTHMWFVPAGKDHYGCMFVGYDDGSAQGGLNTEGLAFDWYAGEPVAYEPASNQAFIEDNSSERMLEQCASVDEAIAFYRKYAEPGFANASILIADASGASVIIGARDGTLFFERSSEGQVLGGQGKQTFERLYTDQTPITLKEGSAILKQCVASGPGGTLYSNAYNLKTQEIYVFDFKRDNYITLSLKKELKKGPHYYEIPEIEQQIEELPKPLLLNMERLILFDYDPMVDPEAKVTDLIRSIFSDGAAGRLNANYFSQRFWSSIREEKESVISEIKSLGSLKSLDLVQKEGNGPGLSTYSYVMVFDRARLLQRFLVNSEGKVEDLQTLSAYVMNPKSIESGPDSPGPGMGNRSPFLWVVLSFLLGGTLAFLAVTRALRSKSA